MGCLPRGHGIDGAAGARTHAGISASSTRYSDFRSWGSSWPKTPARTPGGRTPCAGRPAHALPGGAGMASTSCGVGVAAVLAARFKLGNQPPLQPGFPQYRPPPLYVQQDWLSLQQMALLGDVPQEYAYGPHTASAWAGAMPISFLENVRPKNRTPTTAAKTSVGIVRVMSETSIVFLWRYCCCMLELRGTLATRPWASR